jgi:hypothetical protein
MVSEHNSENHPFFEFYPRSSYCLTGDKVLEWRFPNLPNEFSSEQDNLICHETVF